MQQERTPPQNELENAEPTLQDRWNELDRDARRTAFSALPRAEAEELFLSRSPHDQLELLSDMATLEKRSWLRLLPLDDTADLLQEMAPEERHAAMALLDAQTQRDVLGLLAYAEDAAGGLMTPRYVRLRPDMSVEEALRYLRAQARESVETVYYAYVLDSDQKLLGAVSFRELVLMPPDRRIKDIMQTDLVTVGEHVDQEEVSRIFSEYDLLAIPVVDESGKMKGIVTHDDVADVLQEEATEDIQKLGGMEALDAPYLSVGLFEMIRKRVGWLVVLFLGEMFTASAMGFFEREIERAVVLALFIPLIISSGGNSGSQASTLIIRSLATHEIELKDWWRVMRRELLSGAIMGLILGLIGALRVILWQQVNPIYSDHYMYVAATVAFSLVGVVIWGTTTGATLPFILRKVGLDPATASAPFVATLVDVTGLVIYFSIASLMLKGLLL